MSWISSGTIILCCKKQIKALFLVDVEVDEGELSHLATLNFTAVRRGDESKGGVVTVTDQQCRILGG